MAIAALVIFVGAYAFLIADRVHRTKVALVGAALILVLRISDSEKAFFSLHTGVEWNVIFLLFGMMVIVSVLRETGVFEYVAIWAAKRSRGRPYLLMVLLVLLTAVASALLDNVTTVLLDRTSHVPGVRPTRAPRGAVPHRRGHGLQHRRRGDPCRRPAEHHHRQPR